MYSKNLAWGYFDHPPMIALVVKTGYLFFKNELGVRLIIILMNTATIFFIEKIINPKNLKLYYAIIASIVLIHYGGVLAVPDIPLLFFTTTFFYLYKRYLQKPSWQIMLLIGINCGLLLLSKYHGILVIGFTLLSNLKLLRKWEFWLAMLLALLLFLPHILWQVNHDFPTIGYQLLDREITRFDYTYVLEFIFTQPLVYGPIVGAVLLFLAFGRKPENQFERSLKFNLIGVFALFFLFTFRGKVEAHWTDIAFVPLVYLGYMEIRKSEKLKRFVFISFPISLFLILAVRLFMMVNFLPSSLHVKTEFHGWDNWAKEIKSKAGINPVVFANSYQNAAKYEFYSGVQSMSLNDERGRRNQYNIWETERKLQGQPVYFLPNYYTDGVDSLHTSVGLFFGTPIPEFKTYPDISIEILSEEQKVNKGDTVSIDIRFREGSKISGNEAVQLYAVFFTRQNQMIPIKTNRIFTNEIIESQPVQTIKVVPPGKGILAIYFSLSNHWFPPTVHSYRIYLEVE